MDAPVIIGLERWSLSAENCYLMVWMYFTAQILFRPNGEGKRLVVTVHDLNFVYYPEFLTAESRRYYTGKIEWGGATSRPYFS